MIESSQDALSLVGQSWDVWLSSSSSVATTTDESTSKAQNGRLCQEEPIVSTMPHKKALCYGFCPTQDEFFLLRCKDCGLLVKPIAYRHHLNTRHALPVRHSSQDVHDREPNCSSRIRHDSGPTPGLSVFSPDSSSHTPDDFDGILLSPVAAHPTSCTPEGARLRRDSQPNSPPSCAAQETTRTRPVDDVRRPPNSRTKKTLRTILPVKAPPLRGPVVKAEEPDLYCVKQRGDLVMKFSKNVSQSASNGNGICVENRKSRNRRKQELTVSPSPNGKGSNVIKSIDLVTPPCSPDRLKTEIASQSADTTRLTSSTLIRATKIEPADSVLMEEEWSSSSVSADCSLASDSNNNKHPKPQSSGACIVRLHARAPPFAVACLATFDRRIDRLRTGLQKTVQAPIAHSHSRATLEASDVRFVDSNAAQRRDTPSLRQLLTSRSTTTTVEYPPAATPRIGSRIVPDIQPPRRQAVLMTATTGAATHNYAKSTVAPSAPTPHHQQQLTLAMHPQQAITSSATVMQHWSRQQPTGTTPTPPMTPSPGVSNKPQQLQHYPVVTTTAGSFVVHHQPLVAQHLLQHAAAFQKPKKRPAMGGGPQRKRPRGAQQRPPALILPPNATFAQVTSNNMGQWRKLSAKATHHTTVGSLPPGTTVLALPAQSQIAGLVESGQLKLLPINGQTSANGTTAFLLPNKNGVVALGRAAMGGRAQPMSVKSLSIESAMGQQPLFVNLQTAHRSGALHMGHGQASCTLVQSSPNATIYRLPLSQSAGGGYSTVHQTTLQSPVALETVHSS